MTALNGCGCCEGLTLRTPVAINNRPGLSAIAYRVGTHAHFKASMLTRLSGGTLPNLSKLKTRDDDDFTIALLDAWALVSDILTFYQERIANESYLRTATERSSIIHLARLIGYELRPGVAASTYLAFTLESGTGAPASVPLATGLKVQSVPGPGQKPQTFETVEAIEARPVWNELKPQLTELRLPQTGDTQMYLSGVTTNLKPGDPILITGADDPALKHWEFQRLTAVEIDTENNRTLVRWKTALTTQQSDARVYALRLRASLFGANAQAFDALPVALRVAEVNPKTDAGKEDPTTHKIPIPAFLDGAYASRKDTWSDAPFKLKGTINPVSAIEIDALNLDTVYNQIAIDSWIILESATHKELYLVNGVTEEAKADFNISAKTTRLDVSLNNIANFSPRTTTVFAQSEELKLAETPLTDSVQGKEIVLDHVVDGLTKGRTLIVTGKRMRGVVGATRSKLFLTARDASQRVPLTSGDSLIVVDHADSIAKKHTKTRWRLLHDTGLEGFVTASPEKINLTPAAADDPFVSEVVHLDEAVLSNDGARTVLKLADALANIYDLTTVTIFANVAFSTHGETVKGEVLGSGDAGKSYQSFTLKQAPLTFTPADTASGGESTLTVRVNELKWAEVETLFGRGPRERIYITEIDDDGSTTVQFGDGITGARPPIGQENVAATYRKGIGLEGLVDAGQLSLLLTRPLGAKSVKNPIAAEGAQDPQQLDDARENSPITVLTLDRIVSLRDYEDFARAFSGIAKALATWTWTGQSRGVLVTVAGIDGAEVADHSVLQTNLVLAMQKAGDAFVPLAVKSCQKTTFNVVADVKVDPDYIAGHVLAAVETALRSTFSLGARSFGQPVTLSEVMAVMQDVAGVVAIDVNQLHRSGAPETRETFLPSYAPQAGSASNALAAELLTLDSGALALTVTS